MLVTDTFSCRPNIQEQHALPKGDSKQHLLDMEYHMTFKSEQKLRPACFCCANGSVEA